MARNRKSLPDKAPEPKPWTKSEIDKMVRHRLDGCVAGGDTAKANYLKRESLADILYSFEWGHQIVIPAYKALWARDVLALAEKVNQETQQPRGLENAIRFYRDELTREIMRGYDAPTSTSWFHNAVALAKAEARRDFVEDLNSNLSFYADAVPDPDGLLPIEPTPETPAENLA